jgi:hypothetical protein
MGIYSININKNDHSPLILIENQEKPTPYNIRNPDPVLGQTQSCGGVVPVNGIPTLQS